jgi:hypothetical protein
MAINTHADLHSGGTMLAESHNVSVFQCSCGNIHLQIGAVCLTMQLDELAEVGTILQQALAQPVVNTPPATASVN